MYKKLTFALCAILTFCSFQSCGDDDKSTEKVDPAFTQALAQLKPNLKSVEWEERSGYLVAEGREGKYDVAVWFTTEAKWAMTETEYGADVSKIPQAVNNTIQASQEYGSWTVDDIDFYERPDMSFYVIELESPQATELYVYITPTGNILKTTTRDENVTPVTSFLTPSA